MNVEFDPKKAESNLRKHGVAFDAASACLLDPLALVMEDPDAIGEARWLLIGMNDEAGLLTVCYALRDEETIRLISARKATAMEKKYYAQGI